MNDALEKGRQEYLRKVRNGEITTRKKLNPMEAAKADPKSRKKAIAAKCFDCCCFQRKEVTLCPAQDCPLWNLRPWQRK